MVRASMGSALSRVRAAGRDGTPAPNDLRFDPPIIGRTFASVGGPWVLKGRGLFHKEAAPTGWNPWNLGNRRKPGVPRGVWNQVPWNRGNRSRTAVSCGFHRSMMGSMEPLSAAQLRNHPNLEKASRPWRVAIQF